jgi:hypothetical protein
LDTLKLCYPLFLAPPVLTEWGCLLDLEMPLQQNN